MIDRKPRSVKRVLLAVWRRHLVFRRSYLAFLWGFLGRDRGCNDVLRRRQVDRAYGIERPGHDEMAVKWRIVRGGGKFLGGTSPDL